MRVWLAASSIRVVSGCAIGILLLAIAFGLLCPDEEGGRTRVAASTAILEPPPQATSDAVAMRIFDADQGSIVRSAPWVGEKMTSPVLSPWRDERGRKLVVGFSWDGIARGERRIERRYGILLARYPDGEALSFAPLDSAGSLGGPLCWLPGTLARVLYSGRDGSLYRIDFERLGGGQRIERLAQPTVLRIACQAALLTRNAVKFNDPAWSSDARWGGRLIVALRYADPTGRKLTPWRLWWLKPNASITAIVDAGPVFPHGEECAQAAEIHERFPSVALGPDRTLRIAYLASAADETGYRLRLARLRLDRNSDLRVLSREDQSLTEDCDEIPPIFSSDGRSVYVSQRSGPVIRRVAVRDSRAEDVADRLVADRGDRIGIDAELRRD
jgi:hypothetical protein